MSITTELSTFDDPSSRRELLTVASFLAGYGTATRTGYTTDLRLFADWCRECGLGLFEVQRSHLELFGRSLEARGLMPSTVARRLGVDELLPILRTRGSRGAKPCNPCSPSQGRQRIENPRP